MTTWLKRVISAIRVALGVYDPSRSLLTPAHGWLLPPNKAKAPAVAPRG